jgi:hypothetical protein
MLYQPPFFISRDCGQKNASGRSVGAAAARRHTCGHPVVVQPGRGSRYARRSGLMVAITDQLVVMITISRNTPI